MGRTLVRPDEPLQDAWDAEELARRSLTGA
jgi:hypothetical protein